MAISSGNSQVSGKEVTGRVRKESEDVETGSRKGAGPRRTEECCYKAGVGTVVLVTMDGYEATQKNEALFTYLHCDL